MALPATPAQHAAPHDDPRATASDHHSHAPAYDGHPVPSRQHDTAHQPSVVPCTHCPLSAAMAGGGSTGLHALCSVADDVSDGGKPSAPPIPFKTTLAAPIVELLPFDHGPGLGRDRQRPSDAVASSSAPNLRHCVLLI
jgi:hypothetical protein